MVIKGKSVAGAARLSAHLQRIDTNERMEVVELRGVAAEDLQGALREMEAVASASPNCKRPFYHASINTRADERLTPEQREQAINRLEKELGLDGQPRVVVAHVKEGREHCHVVWSRIDLETMRTISDSHNYRKHELVARELEREFGHQRVQGAHIEREGVERPERTPSHKDMQQAERTKVTPEAAREHLTALWRSTDNGSSFKAALEQSGWALARGDRRDFVALDPQGGTHSIARRIEGVTTQAVRNRFADLDRAALPSVAECRETLRARQSERAKPGRDAAKQGGKQPPAKDRPKTAKRSPDAPTRARVIGGIARTPKLDHGRPQPGKGVERVAGKLLDGAASLFEGLLGGGPSKPKEGTLDTPRVDPGPTPQQERAEQARQNDQGDQAARHAKYLQDFSREVPQERERDAEIERDTKGRERKRGE